MALTESQQRAVALSLANEIPFVAYSLPGNDEAVFWADNGDEDAIHPRPVVSRRRFGIYQWRSDAVSTISDRLSACDVISQYGNSVHDVTNSLYPLPLTVSTPRSLYLERVALLIARLKQRGGKTVYSRVFCGEYPTDSGPLTSINRLFDGYTSTFNAVYFHPAVGAWMLSSPELLLKVDKTTGRYETMSLAGTRQMADNGLPWDDKNINEQRIVTEYICDTLRGLGLPCETGPLETVTSGAVQHLRNIIRGDGVTSPISVTSALNPTPALGGFPKRESLQDIEMLELQPRRCYGGFLTVEDADDTFRAYVNLRCCQFDMRRYCLYAGGGITPQSDPEEEWRETESKLLRLLAIIG